MVVVTISADDTWPLRHRAMWPNKPIDFIKLDEDASGLHYGIFLKDKLVSCVSLFMEGDTAQFRKLATLREHQRKGYASALINHMIDECHHKKVKRLWCNARIDKTDFYSNFGFLITNKQFIKAGKAFVVMEQIF